MTNIKRGMYGRNYGCSRADIIVLGFDDQYAICVKRERFGFMWHTQDYIETFYTYICPVSFVFWTSRFEDRIDRKR